MNMICGELANNRNPDKTNLFTGDPSLMGKVLLEKFEEWKAANLAEKPKKKVTKSATTKEKTTKSYFFKLDFLA